MERRNSATAAIGLARSDYLPSAAALWQGNRATRNNIFGLLLPQSVIPSIAGPVLADADNESVWGSAAGVLVGWEPFDFGTRRASVDAARATERSSAAELDLTKLGIAAAAAERFLTLTAAQQEVDAAAADLQRRESFAKVVHVLVTNELKPGADASRADAELARARIVLIRAQTAVRVDAAVLADLLGVPASQIQIEGSELWHELPKSPGPSDVQHHPAALAQSARVDTAKAQVSGVDRSYYPRFLFQSAVSGRGSGANVDGTTEGGAAGLELQRQNWAVGLTATFNILDIFAIRERKKIAEANERAEQARYEQTLQDLNAQVSEVQAVYDGAVAIADATPIELADARQNEMQARARYQAGLTTVVEVTDAQSLLVRAESDDNVAKLSVWRALFAIAAARGNLQPAIDALPTPAGGR